MFAKKICPNCGHTGRPRYEARGTFRVEILLWLLFIVPGFLYTLWRETNRRPVCRKCGYEHLIPLDTPRGMELTKAFAPTRE